MKKLAALFLSLAFFCSCSTTYYYSTLNSNNDHVIRTNDGDFVVENDSLYIIYSFFGENAPINIGVYNKSGQPLFVDWSQSALIIDNVAQPLQSDEVAVRGGSNSTVYVNKSYSYNNSFSVGEAHTAYEGGMTLPRSTSFVPPQSQINHTSYQLANFPFDAIDNDVYGRKDFAKTDGVVRVRTIDFTEADSPLRFRSYITIYADHPSKETSKRMSFEQSFYLSTLMKTKGNIPPEDVLAYNSKQGDFFYVKHYKESNFAVAMGVIAVGAAVITLDAAVNPGNQYYE